jgi:DUF1680 family protein
MQGWPKFISNAFLTADNGTSLVHLYHGPFSVTTELAGSKSIPICLYQWLITIFQDNKVTINVDTHYPFSDNVKVIIDANQPFKYRVRVPSWVVKGSIASNGALSTALNPDANGLHTVSVSAGQTILDLALPAAVTTGKHSS